MPDVAADPFAERRRLARQEDFWLLGTRCTIASDDARLMRLARAACGDLPRQQLAGPAPRCRLELRLTAGGGSFRAGRPPPLRTDSGAGLLTGVVDAANHVVVAPAKSAAVVHMSAAMLAHPYHARYELIEFALLSLLSRVRGLVPLHAACVGDRGRGLLLLGESGAGKSTLCFRAAVGGLRLLAEDSVFVEPDSLMACALPAFVHLRRDGPRLLGATSHTRLVRASSVIRRRSGERKYEIDLRKMPDARLAGALQLVGVVCLTRQQRVRPLREIATRRVLAKLRREQAYAAGQYGWSQFLGQVAQLPAFELARGADSGQSVSALLGILNGGR